MPASWALGFLYKKRTVKLDSICLIFYVICYHEIERKVISLYTDPAKLFFSHQSPTRHSDCIDWTVTESKQLLTAGVVTVIIIIIIGYPSIAMKAV